MAASTKDGLALRGDVSDVGELMAVELEHSTEYSLLVPLSAEASLHIVHILVQDVD